MDKENNAELKGILDKVIQKSEAQKRILNKILTQLNEKGQVQKGIDQGDKNLKNNN